MSERLLLDVEALALLFKEGGWAELRVRSAEVSLLFSKDAEAGLDRQDIPPSPEPASAKIALMQQVQNKKSEQPVVAQPVQSPVGSPSWAAVTAPNIGTFYRSPKPGAEPFVVEGQEVAADTEICLLEVMKLFTSVKAGVAGTIMQICASDAQLVEGGQILFYVQPN
jgi:acetyl-CoA carboxylase biotin carboxyl carrier protein